jgi:ATP-dependent DNA helicase RecQ
MGAAVKLLRGEVDPRLSGAGLDRTSTFGVLAGHTEEWLLRLLRRCVSAGFVDFAGGERPVAILTEEGGAVMRAERPARLLLPPLRAARAPLAAGRVSRGGAAPASDALDDAARGLFDALRRHRLEVARAAGVPPYVVATDRALRDIAALRPATLGDLEQAHGIGPAKAKRYGEGLLAVVRASAENEGGAGGDPPAPPWDAAKA